MLPPPPPRFALRAAAYAAMLTFFRHFAVPLLLPPADDTIDRRHYWPFQLIFQIISLFCRRGRSCHFHFDSPRRLSRRFDILFRHDAIFFFAAFHYAAIAAAATG